MVTFSTNNRLQLYMQSNSTDIGIIGITGDTGSSPVRPNAPSMILTINQIR